MSPIEDKKEITIDELATFCKRKGFVYPSAEIYGGLAGFYDYGHLGASLKKNFEKIWRKYFLELNDNFYEIEASEVMPENVFVASGHLKNFTDLAVKCKKGHLEKAEGLIERKTGKKVEGITVHEAEKLIKEHAIRCSVCGESIVDVSPVNMMFPITLGVGTGVRAFFRPETAQSPYVNFKNEFEVARGKLPLGLALIGKAYRNEISPRNFLIRQRSFTQAELQIFFNSSKINEHEDFDSVKNYKLMVVLNDSRGKETQEVKCSDLLKKLPKFYVYYLAKVQQFYLDILKFPEEKFRLFELSDKEKAFYNKYHFDIEVDISNLGWTELGGVHYRTDHDLKGHEEISKQNLSVLDEETKAKFVPHVLELSFGVDRNFVALMSLAYEHNKERDNIILHLNPKLAPYTAGVFPIVKGAKYEKLAGNIVKDLRKEFSILYDKSGSIGRRYARNDEMGTPFTITIDEDSLRKKTATIRDRDTTKQVRVKIDELKDVLRKLVAGEIKFEKAGKAVETRVK